MKKGIQVSDDLRPGLIRESERVLFDYQPILWLCLLLLAAGIFFAVKGQFWVGVPAVVVGGGLYLFALKKAYRKSRRNVMERSQSEPKHDI